MTAPTTTTSSNAADVAETPRRPNWWLGVLGFIGGHLLLLTVINVFFIWGGIDNSIAFSDLIFRGELGLPVIALLAGMLGGIGGAYGFGLYLRGNIFSAFLWGAVGFAVGAALTMVIRQIFGLDPILKLLPVVTIGTITAYLGFALGLGSMTTWLKYMIGGEIDEDDHSGHGATSWKSYFGFNTDHKVIGIQYIVFNFMALALGGVFAMLMRAELAQPGQQYIDGAQYNAAFSAHGALMLFFFIIPIFAGIGNYVIPLMLGAADMAFPRLNGLSFWTLVFAFLCVVSGLFVGLFEAGWTAYAPLSTQGEIGLQQLMFALTVQFVGASSIMTAVNFIVTIIGMRAPGLSMWRLPLFVWANLTTSVLVVLGTPFIGGAQMMVLLDLVLGTNFFDPIWGGDPIAYQHIFWFYSHPAVYIMMLPGFGIVSDLITTHSRKNIFGYKAVAISTMAIGFLGFVVWAHHMFTSGMPDWFRLPMMALTMLIAVPTGIKVLSWSATLWQGRIHLTTPMLFVLGFLFTFTVGGVTGIMLAAVPVDIQLHDTYFVVAHFHYVLFGGAVMAAFGGIYHWFPKMTGRMYDETLGKWHFWLMFISQNLLFFPMHWTGMQGMVRRYADHGDKFSEINMFMTWSAFVMAGSMLIFYYNMANSWRRGPKAPANPWKAHTLEWQVSSPPPLFNFYDTPRVLDQPYPYGESDRIHAVIAEKGGKTEDHPALATAGAAQDQD